MGAHNISRVAFRLGFASANDVDDVQERISEFAQNKLSQLIEASIEASIGLGAQVQLNNLTLNLGEIKKDDLERELQLRLKEQIGDVLRRFTYANQLATKEPITQTFTLTEGLRHYLLFGQHHWRAPFGHSDLSGCIHRLLNVNPIGAVSVFRKLWGLPQVRERVRQQLSDTVLNRLLSALSVDQQQNEIQTLLSWHKRDPLCAVSCDAFGRALVLSVLDHALRPVSGAKQISIFGYLGKQPAETHHELGREPGGSSQIIENACNALSVSASDVSRKIFERLQQSAPAFEDVIRAEKPKSAKRARQRQNVSTEMARAKLDQDAGARFANSNPVFAPGIDDRTVYGGKVLNAYEDMTVLEKLAAILKGPTSRYLTRRLSEEDFCQLLRDAVNIENGAIRELLSDLGGADDVAQSLLANFSKPALDHLTITLLPEFGGFAVAITDLATQVLKQDDVDRLYQASLSFLISEPAGAGDAKKWLKHVVESAARKCVETPLTLAAQLGQAADANKSEPKFAACFDVLYSIWPALRIEEPKTSKRTENPENAPLYGEADISLGLLPFLQRGTKTRQRDLSALLMETLATNPEGVKAFITAHASNVFLGHRIANLLPVHGLSIFVKLMLGNAAQTKIMLLEQVMRRAEIPLTRYSWTAIVVEGLVSEIDAQNANMTPGSCAIYQIIKNAADDLGRDPTNISNRVKQQLAENQATSNQHTDNLAARTDGNEPESRVAEPQVHFKSDAATTRPEPSKERGMIQRLGDPKFLGHFDPRHAGTGKEIVSDPVQFDPDVPVTHSRGLETIGQRMTKPELVEKTVTDHAAGPTTNTNLGSYQPSLQKYSNAENFSDILATVHQKLRQEEIESNARRPITDACGEGGTSSALKLDLSVDRIAIENAGLVLFWNDLPLYFDRLGLLKDGVFSDVHEAGKAAHFAQYLVNERTNTPEHEMALNKVLCGLYPESSVLAKIYPTGTEMKLANGLVHSLCQRWGPLQGTSIEGMRETFLNRPGILSRPDSDGPLTLDVERGPFDMLLDRLPWGITTIKTRWMKEVLFVKWR